MKKYTMPFTMGMIGTMVALGSMAVTAHAAPSINVMDKTFINTVGHGNTAEVQASRLALKKSSDKKVRMIASMLVQQHGKAQQDLVALGSKLRTPVPTMPDPTQKAQYKMLTHLSGAAFDKSYMKSLVGAHYATLSLFKQEMAKGGDPMVRSFAQQYITDIQNHTQMIANVASNLGIRVAEDPGMGHMNGMMHK